MNKLKKTITWKNVKGTQEQIKDYVNQNHLLKKEKDIRKVTNYV